MTMLNIILLWMKLLISNHINIVTLISDQKTHIKFSDFLFSKLDILDQDDLSDFQLPITWDILLNINNNNNDH